MKLLLGPHRYVTHTRYLENISEEQLVSVAARGSLPPGANVGVAAEDAIPGTYDITELMGGGGSAPDAAGSLQRFPRPIAGKDGASCPSSKTPPAFAPSRLAEPPPS